MKLSKIASAVILPMALGTSAMAAAFVVSNGATQWDYGYIDTTNNIANLNISGSAGYATSAGSASTATTATNVSGGTASVTTLSTSGATSLGSTLSVTGTATTNGITNTGNISTGTLSTSGNATVGGTLGVSGLSTTAGIANTGIFSQTGTSIFAGDTSINTGVNNTANTTIGSYGDTGNTGRIDLSVGGTGTLMSGTNGSINLEYSNTANAAYSGIKVNAGMDGFGAVSMTADDGTSNVVLNHTSASITSGNSGLTTYSTSQVVGTDIPLVSGNAASQALVSGASVTNVIRGNTLVDGNMYINGTLTYSSNTSASTTVTSGVSELAGGTTTNGAMVISNSGGASVNANGALSTTGATGAVASLTLTNGIGNTHGLVVTESQATLSGGTRSTSLTMNDTGATFSNAETGAPVKVTGVADGTSDFDAVNYRQLKQIAAGVAGVSAMANIPQVDENKVFALGAGVGHFQDQTALSVGGSYRMASNTVIKASLATTTATSKTSTFGLGVGYSW